MANSFPIEVVYATPINQVMISLAVEPNTTVLQAIHQSGVLLQYPEIGTEESLEGRIGIFGKVVALDSKVKAGDRIEIYRSLRQDPMEARRLRAKLNPLRAPIRQPRQPKYRK